MTTALSSTSFHNPRQCLTGLIEVMHRLNAELGITVTYAAMPDHELVDYDETTKLVKVRHTATLGQQLAALNQIWNLATLGAWAAPAARPQPRLYLVPAPRDASNN